LLNGVAKVYRFRMSADFNRIFLGKADNLHLWQLPRLPEDPAFYREDGSLMFGSITHEHDAFIELLAAEEMEFIKSANVLKMSLDPDDQEPIVWSRE
jgi:hypothetical protein